MIKHIKAIGCFIVLLLLVVCEAQSKPINLTLRLKKGNVDYSSAIQSYLDTLAWNGGGTLYIPYGVYRMESTVKIECHVPHININIVGIKNKTGNLPTFIDDNKNKAPHSFFLMNGNWDNPTFQFKMENVKIVGNNYPHSNNHGYFHKKYIPIQAVRCMNIKTAIFNNVDIINVYGDGIALVNNYESKTGRINRIEKPIIRNCKILNCWSWNGKDDGGDGIMLWSVNGAVIENCQIINNLSVTKSYSRAGIVVEHNAENVKIVNNIISGYQRNIHIEGTFGGHLIEKNKISASSVAITFNEVDYIRKPNVFSSTSILSNEISYDVTKQNGIHRPFRDWSFISANMNGKFLANVIIRNNAFNYINGNTPSGKATINLNVDDNVFISFRNTNGYDKKYVNSGNTFTLK